MSIDHRIAERLKAIESAALRRSLRAPSGVDFSSNDYLGLARHPRVTERFVQAARAGGVGSTGSRLLRGHRDEFEAVERKFATWKQCEASLYLSTGYTANLSVLTTFCEEGDVIFSDEKNHASLIDGVRLSRATKVIFPHNDVAALRALMERNSSGQQFVVVESLYSMDGDFAPLAELAALCDERGAALIVDEAHACGVFGTRGSGLLETSGVRPFLSINTAGKALGVAGAFVCGSQSAIDLMINRARPFIFSTAPTPPVAAAIDEAISVVMDEPETREVVMRRSRELRKAVAELGVDSVAGSSQIIPVIVGENDAAMCLAEKLQRDGLDVRAVRPPTVPKGSARLRISMNAHVTDAEVEALIAALRRHLK